MLNLALKTRMSIVCPPGINGTAEVIDHILHYHKGFETPLLVLSALITVIILCAINVLCHFCFAQVKFILTHVMINGIFWVLFIFMIIDGVQKDQVPLTVDCYICDIVNSTAVCKEEPDEPPFAPPQKKRDVDNFIFRYDLFLRYKRESTDDYSFVPESTDEFIDRNVPFVNPNDLLIDGTHCYCYDDTASLRSFHTNHPPSEAFYITFGVIGIGYLFVATIYSIASIIRCSKRDDYIEI